MNFREQQNTLINFTADNYKNYLPANIAPPEIVNDVLDFDKFKNDFSLFIDFSRIDFRQSSYDDDCGDIEHLSLTFYLVRRNNTPDVLNADILDAAYSLYQMIKNQNSLGIAQNTTIESIDLFRYVEGNKYLVCAEFTINMEIEL
jgi:hypothetical protein